MNESINAVLFLYTPHRAYMTTFVQQISIIYRQIIFSNLTPSKDSLCSHCLPSSSGAVLLTVCSEDSKGGQRTRRIERMDGSVALPCHRRLLSGVNSLLSCVQTDDSSHSFWWDHQVGSAGVPMQRALTQKKKCRIFLAQVFPIMQCSVMACGQSNRCKHTFLVDFFVTLTLYFYCLPGKCGNQRWLWL